MNRLIKIVFIFLCLFIFTIEIKAKELEYTNNTTNYKLIIEDDADLLSEEEEQKLQDKMIPLTEYGNVAFKTIDYNSTSTSKYTADYYNENFGTTSGVVFLIDMDNRMIYIDSDGYIHKIITKSKENIITDNVYKHASYEQYYECAYNAYDQMYTLLEGGKISEPMRYINNILISIVVAFLFNFILVFNKTKIKRAPSDEVLKNCDVTFEVSNIVGKISGTHRVYSPVSDSSSGGGHSSFGGGHSSGGGGGHSSGGGGGHRF